MTEDEKINHQLDNIIKVHSRYGLSNLVDRTDDGIVFKLGSKNKSKGDLLGNILMILIIIIPPALLFYFESSNFSRYLAIFWIAMMGYKYYQVIIIDNDMILNVTKGLIAVENKNLLFRKFLKNKVLNFSQIQEFEMKRVMYTRWDSGSQRIKLRTRDDKKYHLIEYDHVFVAEKTKNILNNITLLIRKQSAQHRSADQAAEY